MNKNIKISLALIFISVITLVGFVYQMAERTEVPEVYSNILEDDGKLCFLSADGKKNYQNVEKAKWRMSDFEDIEFGEKGGINLKFKTKFEGTVIYGLYPDEPTRFHNAVFFKKHISIKDGEAFIKIGKYLTGKYDMANWEAKGYGKIRYRILDEENNIITNKCVAFTVKDSVFSIACGITAGPFISAVTTNSLKITFWTNLESEANLNIDGKTLKSEKSKKHVFEVAKLEAGKKYDYEIGFPNTYFKSYTKTAPAKGDKSKFSFGFASDSRGGSSLGETNLMGHNAYIMRKMAALINYKNLDFFQFTGDMIDGYKSDKEQMRLEYANWLRTLSPYMHTIPMNVGFGNHEAFLKSFGDHKKYYGVDNYPFETESAEALFGEFFENPENGPESEDGNELDPDANAQNFPSYKKSVYSYTYGNTAMIVLNSNYWYTPNQKSIAQIGGNAHGYIMQMQMQWLQKEINKFEADKDIKHVFVTIHTPAFPNGGHANNDMWYKGDNTVKPYVAGKGAKNGIIDQRDLFLDILVNKSTKFRVLLTGDEHNYSRLHINKDSKIYPEDWQGKKIVLKREFVQIVNGAAGAPYYAKENLPWTGDLQKFSSQYALVIFHVDGDKIIIEVINPDTLETIEKVELI